MINTILYSTKEDREYDSFIRDVFKLELGNPKEEEIKILKRDIESILEKHPEWAYLDAEDPNYQTHQVNDGRNK